ncbi:MAG: pseudouridine synthase, partial [Gammaproteobacteria bacterium]|nr:pseudouridine synthase [Gammaproteobacteria bacterium]
ISQQQLPQHWQIENRLEKSKPAFTMHEVDGKINAQSEISLIEIKNQLGLFELKPSTGKTHQLRLHMMKIGAPILNDKFYPQLLPEQTDNFDIPLQLLAKTLNFNDPLTGKSHIFESKYKLEMFN